MDRKMDIELAREKREGKEKEGLWRKWKIRDRNDKQDDDDDEREVLMVKGKADLRPWE